MIGGLWHGAVNVDLKQNSNGEGGDQDPDVDNRANQNVGEERWEENHDEEEDVLFGVKQGGETFTRAGNRYVSVRYLKVMFFWEQNILHNLCGYGHNVQVGVPPANGPENRKSSIFQSSNFLH